MSENPVTPHIDKILTDNVLIPVEISPKGIKTITIDLDVFQMIETGTKVKEVKGVKTPVAYMKFLITK